MARSITLGDRFWSKVKKLGEDDCWEWTGSRNNKGYGKFSWGHSNWILSHRVAFFLAHGRWPDPQALHSCDNPACNNAKHLFEGTQKVNVQDASFKGRMNKPHPSVAGENHPRAKLTWATAGEIRRETATEGTSLNKLADKYHVAKKTVFNVVHNKTWASAPIHP